jgi:Protein of unknown function VcgC/VcgE (DUF2780)
MRLRTLIVTITTAFNLMACNTAHVEQSNQALNGASQILQQGQQIVGIAQAIQNGSLTDLLMQRVGVNQNQAQVGAGALFQLAKSQMQPSAFSQLTQAVPGMNGLLNAAPAMGSSGGIMQSMGVGGNLMVLASVFQQQGMSPSMVQQFIPVMVDYVKGTGGNGIASSLSSALLGQ